MRSSYFCRHIQRPPHRREAPSSESCLTARQIGTTEPSLPSAPKPVSRQQKSLPTDGDAETRQCPPDWSGSLRKLLGHVCMIVKERHSARAFGGRSQNESCSDAPYCFRPQFFFDRPTSEQVYLSKRIPPEAGLGGGSANAATALFAANVLAGNLASAEDLQLWSAELGSDITFFLSTGTCYCTGRGEVLHPQDPLPQAR